MILDAIATHPQGTKAVTMVATDGVYFTSPHPGLPQSNKIGDWEEAEHGKLTQFKPGVYWNDETRKRIADGKDPVFKARGTNAKAFGQRIADIDAKFAGWNGRYPQSEDEWPAETFPIGFSMVTALQALQWGKWFLAGRVSSDDENQQMSCPDRAVFGKRGPGYFDAGLYRSTPPKTRIMPDGMWEWSIPYKKGMAVSETTLESGISPDGTPKLLAAEMLGTVK